MPDTTYGVFSQLSAFHDEADSEEMLYRIADTELECLVWMGRFIAFRAFQVMPFDKYVGLMTLLDRHINTGSFDKVYNVLGVTYYVRAIPEAELADLAQHDVNSNNNQLAVAIEPVI